jgi:hypothetical protein
MQIQILALWFFLQFIELMKIQYENHGSRKQSSNEKTYKLSKVPEM